MLCTKALHNRFRHRDPARLEPPERKSLTSFSFGANAWILAPEMSNQVLSCLVDPTNLVGPMNNIAISGASIKFPIDNVRLANAGWACETDCFANNPTPDLQNGLGELEIKTETIRHIVCAGADLIQDSSFDIQGWVLQKVAQAFRNTINAAIILGNGVGMPLGLLNPNRGIPACETSPVTPAGQFTWQDLVMLKFEVPMEWQAGCSYLMNQRTFGLLLTMSDSAQRPIWGQLPGGLPGFTLAGSPINIVTQMPDVQPGSTPIAFGNWRAAYTIVNPRATTMLTDPYSAGWCTLFKFDARLGGAVTCSNAARLLRIR